MNDRSVVPALKAFIEGLEKKNVDPLGRSGADDVLEAEFYETAACTLRSLGEPAHYEKLVTSMLETALGKAAAGGPAEGAGLLRIKLAPDPKDAGRQLSALSRLAMLRGKANNLAEADRTYAKIVELCLVKQDEASLKAFDKNGDGTLGEEERKARDAFLDSIQQGTLQGEIAPPLRTFLGEYWSCRNTLRSAQYTRGDFAQGD